MMALQELAQVFQDWHLVQFVHPEWFYLFGSVLGLWLVHYLRPSGSDWEQTASAQSLLFRHPLIDQLGFNASVPSSSKGIRWLLNLLRLMLLAGIVTALAMPVKKVPLPPEPQTKTVRDIVFVVETSVSMVLEDYQIDGKPQSRVKVIQDVLDQFISGLAGNRFGFILYADDAYTLMPLTSDATTARLMLKRLKPYLAGRTDEATGEALGLALQQAEKSVDSTENRIVVLISDGSTRNSRLPIAEAINYAQGLNIPIYTIGVGGSSKEADQRKFRGLLYEALESDSLKQIAEQTNGRYYQIGSGQDLQKVLQTIDQTEGVAIEVPKKKFQQVALYPYVIALSVMLFVFYFALVQLLGNRLQREAV
ncbi:VWA domain-containing protein [Hydrogenovibrio sp. 3SP14C1]|uniref:vWA domain-containing protein n=1 Tax=Hydrogenovibrio sp. 3SP14C1 TaxID=3038774 RepID=UPI0024177C06|nr:VWA domain-containing protein [Hydrogenovibrio sp. 3SP14C1]MDG4813529.1 VWA domain-containing protein [Hydrogenovibrio sp. 3SP14C1]